MVTTTGVRSAYTGVRNAYTETSMQVVLCLPTPLYFLETDLFSTDIIN